MKMQKIGLNFSVTNYALPQCT